LLLGVLAHRLDTFLFDQPVSRWMRELGPGFEPVADVFNEGNAVLALGAVSGGVALMTWRRNAAGVLLFLLAAGGRPYLTELKEWVGRPRPSGDFEQLDRVFDSSFPSGHAMTAVVFWGLWIALAPALLPRRWVLPARILFTAAIVLSAASRMWAGVHWFSDTWGAVVWGGALVLTLLAARPGLETLCARIGESFRPASTRRE
jgi:undecaprenyl-diphosphatase